MINEPTTIVCAGGGGVGKTTTSAAIALALARSGYRTLIITVDPARRLAQAMGVEITDRVQPASVDPDCQGRLYALMPDPRESTTLFLDLIFAEESEARARILKNRVYQFLADAAAGMHEIVALMLVAKAIEDDDFDFLVIDTAPSRHALDFIAHPRRLVDMLEGRAVNWIAGLARKSQGDEQGGGGLLAAGRRRIESLFSRMLNPETLRAFTDMFAELSLVKDRFAWMARLCEELLTGKSTRFVLVSAPTRSAEADVKFLAKRLESLERQASALLLNRADRQLPPWLDSLLAAKDLPAESGALARSVSQEIELRVQAGDRLAASMGEHFPGVPQCRVSTQEKRDPSAIVAAIADELAGSLGLLAGPTFVKDKHKPPLNKS